MLGRTRIALHVDHIMLFMSVLSIQLIFSLLSFVVFSFSLFICRCAVALSHKLQVSNHEDFTTTSALESIPFHLFMFSCHFHSMLYYDTCMSTSFGHVYLFYVLTMEVFTTSWWVVNQSIVAIVFIYAFTGYKLVILPLVGLNLYLCLLLLNCILPLVG